MIELVRARLHAIVITLTLVLAVSSLHWFAVPALAAPPAEQSAAQKKANEALLLYNAEEFERAAICYLEAYDLDPDGTDWLYSAARAFDKAGMHERAALTYRRYLADPGKFPEHTDKASKHLYRVETELAIEHAERVFREGDFTLAARYFLSAWRRNRDTRVLLYRAAQSYDLANELESAKEYYELFISAPGDSQGLVGQATEALAKVRRRMRQKEVRAASRPESRSVGPELAIDPAAARREAAEKQRILEAKSGWETFALFTFDGNRQLGSALRLMVQPLTTARVLFAGADLRGLSSSPIDRAGVRSVDASLELHVVAGVQLQTRHVALFLNGRAGWRSLFDGSLACGNRATTSSDRNSVEGPSTEFVCTHRPEDQTSRLSYAADAGLKVYLGGPQLAAIAMAGSSTTAPFQVSIGIGGGLSARDTQAFWLSAGLVSAASIAGALAVRMGNP